MVYDELQIWENKTLRSSITQETCDRSMKWSPLQCPNNKVYLPLNLSVNQWAKWMKLHFKVRRSHATDCTHRREKMSVLSNAKHKVETNYMGEICPRTKACAEPMHLKLKPRGHISSGALTWRCTLSPVYTTTAEAGGYTQRMHSKDKEGSRDLDTPECVVCPSSSKTCEWQVLSETDDQTWQKLPLTDPKPTAIKGSPLQQTTCSTYSFSEYSQSATRKYQRYIEQRVSYSIVMSISPSWKTTDTPFSLLDAVKQFNGQISSHNVTRFHGTCWIFSDLSFLKHYVIMWKAQFYSGFGFIFTLVSILHVVVEKSSKAMSAEGPNSNSNQIYNIYIHIYTRCVYVYIL